MHYNNVFAVRGPMCVLCSREEECMCIVCITIYYVHN